MAYPARTGDALELLRQKFGTDEPTELSPLCGIPEDTLYGWRENGKAKLTKPGKKHWDRIFGEQKPPVPQQAQSAPDLAAIAERIAGVERRLDQLLTIRSPKRLEQMIEASATLTDSDRELLRQVIEGLVSQREVTQEALRMALARPHATASPPSGQRRKAR